MRSIAGWEDDSLVRMCEALDQDQCARVLNGTLDISDLLNET